MQKDFITVTPDSGSGDATLNVVATQNTEDGRSTSFAVGSSSLQKTVSVLQEAKEKPMNVTYGVRVLQLVGQATNCSLPPYDIEVRFRLSINSQQSAWSSWGTIVWTGGSGLGNYSGLGEPMSEISLSCPLGEEETPAITAVEWRFSRFPGNIPSQVAQQNFLYECIWAGKTYGVLYNKDLYPNGSGPAGVAPTPALPYYLSGSGIRPIPSMVVKVDGHFFEYTE